MTITGISHYYVARWHQYHHKLDWLQNSILLPPKTYSNHKHNSNSINFLVKINQIPTMFIASSHQSFLINTLLFTPHKSIKISKKPITISCKKSPSQDHKDSSSRYDQFPLGFYFSLFDLIVLTNFGYVGNLDILAELMRTNNWQSLLWLQWQLESWHLDQLIQLSQRNPVVVLAVKLFVLLQNNHPLGHPLQEPIIQGNLCL